MLYAQEERAPLHAVTAVRSWSLADVTRIAVEVSGDFKFRTDRLHNPERVYFDVLNALPRIDGKRIFSKDINDKLVQRVRLAETHPGTTRVVLDLVGPVEISTSQLSNPNRLIIELRPGELRPGTGPAIPTEAEPALPTVKPPVPIKAEIRAEPKAEIRAAPKAPLKPETKPEIKTEIRAEAKAETPRPVAPAARPVQEPEASAAKTSQDGLAAKAEPGQNAKSRSAPAVPSKTASTPKSKTPSEPLSAELAAASAASATAAIPETQSEVKAEVTTIAASAPLSPLPGEFGRAAKRTSTGGNSLTRALGLKVGRIVIDAGHGGHDQGTQSPHGLLEKELVLDVALRVGKLIEERMNAEVIYTRSDDTFVPLEGRTAIANQKKADLFLSIHANSSPIPRISGMETFYLNFSDSKDALDVAARENASSQKSIFELQDIIHKITLHEKLDESREFAGRIQTALFTFSSRNIAGQKNRGVKKAPFVVLIGANMPSVLAEIGFLSNPREEVLLKKPDYRQKLAESLYRGVSKYADSLSHFQTAAN